MYQKNTKNKSFKNVSKYLYENGIDNNTFMMEVKNKELLDFDITKLDEGSADEINHLKEMCQEEISNNIYFFFREYVRIKDDAALYGMDHVYDYIHYDVGFDKPYVVNPYTLAMIYLYDHNINFIVDINIPGVKMTMALLYYYDEYIKNRTIYNGKIGGYQKSFISNTLGSYDKTESDIFSKYIKFKKFLNVTGYDNENYFTEAIRNSDGALKLDLLPGNLFIMSDSDKFDLLDAYILYSSYAFGKKNISYRIFTAYDSKKAITMKNSGGFFNITDNDWLARKSSYIFYSIQTMLDDTLIRFGPAIFDEVEYKKIPDIKRKCYVLGQQWV